VLDLWFEHEMKLQLHGKAILLRFADDLLIGFERREDAEKVERALVKRLAEWGLELHPDKTQLVDFRRPPLNHRGPGPDTFDFLGFTVLWKRGRKGRRGWYMATFTRVSRLRRAKKAIHDWCRRHRHQAVKEQHAALVRRIRGHFNYYGVRGNEQRLDKLIHAVERAWYKWLNRRSQRSTLDLGEVSSPFERLSPPSPQSTFVALGLSPVSRISGGTVWWKSPSTGLARGPAG